MVFSGRFVAAFRIFCRRSVQPIRTLVGIAAAAGPCLGLAPLKVGTQLFGEPRLAALLFVGRLF